MERTVRRAEHGISKQEVDAKLLEEAKKAGDQARVRIMGVAGEERQKYMEDVERLLKKGSSGGGAPFLPPPSSADGSSSSAAAVGEVGAVGGFDFQQHLEEQAKLEAKARVHSEWLSRQLVTAAAAPGGRLALPFPSGEETGEVYVYLSP